MNKEVSVKSELNEDVEFELDFLEKIVSVNSASKCSSPMQIKFRIQDNVEEVNNTESNKRLIL